MFKDKVKVTVVALVMVLLMVLSITTDLFVGLADIFRAKAEEATPTDATPVTRDVTVYKELNDSDKDRNLAGAVIKVFKDSECTESITEFVLSYDGKSYGGDDRVVYKNLEERANANASKASDAWEVRECQKSANLTAQVNQAKTRCTTASTHTESTQNSMDVF